MHLHFPYRADVEREAAGPLLHGPHGRQLSQLGKRVRGHSTGGHIYGVRGCEDLDDVTLKTFECSFEPQRMVANRESLKGSSQAVRICGEKIAFACLKKVNKTQLSHLVSPNLGRAF